MCRFYEDFKLDPAPPKTPLQGWQCPRCGKVWRPFYYGACDCFVPHVITGNTTNPYSPEG